MRQIFCTVVQLKNYSTLKYSMSLIRVSGELPSYNWTQNILIVVMNYFNLCNCTCKVYIILVIINCNAHVLVVQEPYKH